MLKFDQTKVEVVLCFVTTFGLFELKNCHTRYNLRISAVLEILQVGPQSGMIMQQEPPTHHQPPALVGKELIRFPQNSNFSQQYLPEVLNWGQ